MTKFSLIKQLSCLTEDSEKSPLPKGLKYQQYEIVVEGSTQVVNIPIKETNLFEQLISELNNVDSNDLNSVLRKVRGIRG